MQPVRKIARKLAHNDVTELRPGKLRVQVVGSCARRDACVTNRANLGFITAIDLFAMTTKTRVMSIRNIINHTNPGPIIGNITSPLFGQANQPSDAGGFGFSESANNRRFELQTRFTF